MGGGGGTVSTFDPVPTFAQWLLSGKKMKGWRLRAMANLVANDAKLATALAVTPKEADLPIVQDVIRRAAWEGRHVDETDPEVKEALQNVTLAWMRYTDMIQEGRKAGRFA